jgi:hypothetical protein
VKSPSFFIHILYFRLLNKLKETLMGCWERRKLHQIPIGIVVAFTREWNKKKYNPMLRNRKWYRDCHVIPTNKTEGDYVLCKVAIMGRIYSETHEVNGRTIYKGSIDCKVAPRYGSKEVDKYKCHIIKLHKNTPMNSWDPSD